MSLSASSSSNSPNASVSSTHLLPPIYSSSLDDLLQLDEPEMLDKS